MKIQDKKFLGWIVIESISLILILTATHLQFVSARSTVKTVSVSLQASVLSSLMIADMSLFEEEVNGPQPLVLFYLEPMNGQETGIEDITASDIRVFSDASGQKTAIGFIQKMSWKWNDDIDTGVQIFMKVTGDGGDVTPQLSVVAMSSSGKSLKSPSSMEQCLNGEILSAQVKQEYKIAVVPTPVKGTQTAVLAQCLILNTESPGLHGLKQIISVSKERGNP